MNRNKTKSNKNKNFGQKLYGFFRKLIILFFAASILSVVAFRRIPVRYTPLMLQRYIENFGDDNFHSRKYWIPINKISHNMVTAVIVSEDNKFLNHNGFDREAIRDAQLYNKQNEGKRKRGGSTITQQTAKNVFLLPSRTWVRKGLEAYFTILIELLWSKERIMEVYLNVIEVGRGMYGVEAAAKYYFGKSAKDLTVSEAAQIASILPGPGSRNILNPPQWLKDRQDAIRKMMKTAESVDEINSAR